MSCQLCSEAQSYPAERVIYSDDDWILRHSSETDILGYLVLQSKRHFLDLSEATISERTTYGGILAKAMKCIRETTQCERVYTFSLAEAVPHFHVHIIPRSKDFNPQYKGRGIMSYPVEPACDARLVREICEKMRV
jgi:diadenosine tetraphosphate (Ap4A) HIT family hydrolase